jgi:hypothetical protein
LAIFIPEFELNYCGFNSRNWKRSSSITTTSIIIIGSSSSSRTAAAATEQPPPIEEETSHCEQCSIWEFKYKALLLKFQRYVENENEKRIRENSAAIIGTIDISKTLMALAKKQEVFKVSQA